MGYTHYWYQKRPFTHEEWYNIVEESKRVCSEAASRGIELVGNMGEARTHPEFTPDHVSFNGLSDDGCETFYLERSAEADALQTPEEVANEGVFSFCKTGRLPYDAAVVTVLHFVRKLAPDAIRVESDGDEEAIRKEL